MNERSLLRSAEPKRRRFETPSICNVLLSRAGTRRTHSEPCVGARARPLRILPLLVSFLLFGCAREKRSDAGAIDRVTTPPASGGNQRSPAPSSMPTTHSTSSNAPGSVSVKSGAWTAGIVRKQPPDAGIALLRSVRAARHEGLDRVVFEFEGRALGGYHLEYVDRPVRRCGSGDVAEIEGDAWLAVVFEPAAAHTEAGMPVLAAREQRPRLDVVREIELTCDFEARVSIVLGVAKPNRYRVMELANPTRLVIDVRR